MEGVVPEVRSDVSVRHGWDMVSDHGNEVGRRRSVVSDQSFVDVRYDLEARRLVVKGGIEGRISARHGFHIRDDPGLDHVARIDERMVRADRHSHADRRGLRLSRRNRRPIRRTVRLRVGEVACRHLEGCDKDACIRVGVVGRNLRFVRTGVRNGGRPV